MCAFQAKGLLQFLVVDNTSTLKSAIASLDPFPDMPTYQGLRTVHMRLKYATGAFSLRQVQCMLLKQVLLADDIVPKNFNLCMKH